MGDPRKLLTLLDVPEAQCRPMTRSESEAFVNCMMMEWVPDAVSQSSANELKSDFGADGGMPAQLAIMIGRLALGGPDMRFSAPAVLFLSSICDRPSDCVLWAHYVVTRTRSSLGGIVDMATLADDFRIGFPTDKGATAIWDAQKRRSDDPPSGSDNCLDAAWPWLPETKAGAA